MMRPGIEHRSPGPLANTLSTRPMSCVKKKYKNIGTNTCDNNHCWSVVLFAIYLTKMYDSEEIAG